MPAGGGSCGVSQHERVRPWCGWCICGSGGGDTAALHAALLHSMLVLQAVSLSSPAHPLHPTLSTAQHSIAQHSLQQSEPCVLLTRCGYPTRAPL